MTQHDHSVHGSGDHGADDRTSDDRAAQAPDAAGAGSGPGLGTGDDAATVVGVVGGGTMGRGIAETALRGGCTVILCDTSEAGRNGAKQRIESALGPVGDRLELVADVSALAGCKMIFEAVPEILELKTTVLGAIEEHVSAETVIATNTSSIPITRLAATLRHPERFVGLHFFNPVPKMPLVELVPAESTAEDTREHAQRFAEDVLGKGTFVVGDRPGFVVNALLIPYLLSAARMYDADYTSAEVIDEAMVLSCGLPIGPLALADFIGLDVLCDVADAMHAETGDPALVVPETLRTFVAEGTLGRKSGSGFFPYNA
ncbi:3-hydroxyacyl-CoA dehydrogenase family protein [Kocuria marina]|uniref:3-hydroxyacyl-CoA dehydrogenase family protein n=1 Tax=Kocuria marina TaxID=223184 RepID=UPI003460BC98